MFPSDAAKRSSDDFRLLKVIDLLDKYFAQGFRGCCYRSLEVAPQVKPDQAIVRYFLVPSTHPVIRVYQDECANVSGEPCSTLHRSHIREVSIVREAEKRAYRRSWYMLDRGEVDRIEHQAAEYSQDDGDCRE